ncbi:MAG TPA: hypothetical protein VFD80_05050, partial [Flavobacteriaceae bacterium]|nr:hypothetical protein [Flavobacteriaceae bacterium]
MNRNILIALTFLSGIFAFGQVCPDPVAEDVQYFCSGASITLTDLDVMAAGTLTWYDDETGT